VGLPGPATRMEGDAGGGQADGGGRFRCTAAGAGRGGL